MQKTTALSTAEAGYYSASTAATEVLYLRFLLDGLGFTQALPTPIHEDNSACIEWGNNVIGERDPDDSDTSRCLIARALTAQVYGSPLLRANVTRLGSLGNPPPLEDRGPL